MSTRAKLTLLELLELLGEEEPPLTSIHPISKEQNDMRLNSIMSIAHLIQGLGQPGWVSVTLKWLDCYDGMEGLLFEVEDPVLVTARTLAALVKVQAERPNNEPISAEEFAEALLKQPFCCLRARAEVNDTFPEWAPEKQTFREFLESIKPTVVPDLWSAERELPYIEHHRKLLLEDLKQSQQPPRPPRQNL